MAKATGVGGVFLRAKDPDALYRWYEQHLGIPRSADGAFMFMGEQAQGVTVFAFFPMETDYFGPGNKAVMINFRVDDLDGVLKRLRAAGVEVDARQEDYSYGRFGWFADPEGNRVELWEPKDGDSAENA
jgi:predicted enzyme related to lactoylglutathione lyase